MNKEEAIEDIKAILCGLPVNLNQFPEKLKTLQSRRLWETEAFEAGADYGYIAALIDIFKITEKEL